MQLQQQLQQCRLFNALIQSRSKSHVKAANRPCGLKRIGIKPDIVVTVKSR